MLSKKFRKSMQGEISWPMVILCCLAALVAYNSANETLKQRAQKHVMACRETAEDISDGLSFANSMVACLKKKNNDIDNLLMRSTFDAVEHTRIVNQDFVGEWLAAQPLCSYRHVLYSDGRFISVPKECGISDAVSTGTWGVYDDKMIWLPDRKQDWTPDINEIIGSRGSNRFSLVEINGSTSTFERIGPAGKSHPIMMEARNTADVHVATGYQWAEENNARKHQECRDRWIGKNMLERSGCDKYVTKVNVVDKIGKMPDYRNWGEDSTTADCQAEVHAYWDVAIADMREQGDDQQADSRLRRVVLPALRECENLDRLR